MRKLMKSKKGFTLVEMLIVVAIIAILVAIGIPVYTAQLDQAETRVQEANLRSAEAIAVAEFLTTGATAGVTYRFAYDANHHNLTLDGNGTYCYVTLNDNGVVTNAAIGTP